jgi:23S rRNA (adenine-N6)-dimethyltransferase
MVELNREPRGTDDAVRRSRSQQRQELARQGAWAIPRERGQRRKVFSQNLLQDKAAIRAYLDAVGSPDVGAVEVGAGDGRLTVELARIVPSLTAVELDPLFVQALRRRTRDLSNVDVLEHDVLTMPPPGQDFVLLGNIPFAITARIVTWALESPHLQSATLITQREYARKRTGDYGRWSLTTLRTWPWWDWRLGPRIGRDSFRPRPSVDAAVLHLIRRSEPLLPASSRERWERVVETGFTGKGGSLHASLATAFPRRRVTAAFDRAGLSHDLVVGFASPDEWLSIFATLEQ